MVVIRDGTTTKETDSLPTQRSDSWEFPFPTAIHSTHKALSPNNAFLAQSQPSESHTQTLQHRTLRDSPGLSKRPSPRSVSFISNLSSILKAAVPPRRAHSRGMAGDRSA